MDTVFMNSENSKTYDPHRLILNLLDKKSEKYVALLNLSIHYTWKNIKKLFQKKIKMSALTWSKEFGLLNG